MKNKWMMIAGVILVLFVIGSIVGDQSEQVNSDTPQEAAVKTEEASAEELKAIEVKADFQDVMDGKQKVVVWINNNSDKNFEGTISVRLKSVLGEARGSDTIFIDKLPPSIGTTAIIWGKEGAAEAEYTVSGQFAATTGYKSKVQYELIFEQPGNHYTTLFIKVEDTSADALTDIIIEKRSIYQSDTMVGFQVFFFDSTQQVEPGMKPDIDNAIANYATNYSSGLSQLKIYSTGETIDI